jgi:hypothetical protein
MFRIRIQLSVDLDTDWETGSGSRQPKMNHKKEKEKSEECHVLTVLNIFFGELDTADEQAINHAHPPSPPSVSTLSLFFTLQGWGIRGWTLSQIIRSQESLAVYK